jgi:hypothetical protein
MSNQFWLTKAQLKRLGWQAAVRTARSSSARGNYFGDRSVPPLGCIACERARYSVNTLKGTTRAKIRDDWIWRPKGL